MSENDNIALAEAIEMSSMDFETLLEAQAINCEPGIEIEVCSEPLEIYPATVEICSEPVVTVEPQSSDDSEEDEDDYDHCEENLEETEEEEEEQDEESTGEYEFEDHGDHYRRKSGSRYDDYDPYDDDNYDFVCKKCKNDNSYDYVTLPPTTLTDVPSLTQIASVCVAATLWNHVNVPQRLSSVTEKCAKNSPHWISLRNEVLSLPHKLPIPNRVAEQIKTRVSGMATKITDWVSYHFRTIFQKNGIDKSVYNHIYHIVWHSNGTINCVETARSMIMSVRLSEVEKFKFLATYCIREEIEELSPLVFMNNVMEYVKFSEYPLIVYWYRYFKNQLHMIAFNNPDLSLNAFMFRLDNVDNWPAKEYFFDRLSRKKQVREAIWLINKKGNTYHIQNALLSKLDEDQRLRVFMQIGVKIITNYIGPPISSNLVLSTWHEIRYFITADKCIHIFRRLLKAEADEMLLTEIWINTPNELKNYLVYANNYEIIEKVLSSWKWANDSNFIFVVFEELHTETKKGITKETFFQTFYEKLLWNGEYERLDRILQCCLPDLEDISEFIRDISMKANFTGQCDHLVRLGDYRKLESVLKFCFPELEENIRFKIYFIKRTSCINRCEHLLATGSYEKLNNLLEFFLPNIEDRLRFKRELLGKSSCTNHCVKLLLQREYQKLNQVVEFCLTEFEEKRRFKADFIKTRCENLLTVDDYENLNRMLKFFLLDNEEEIRIKRELLGKTFCINHCEKLLLQGEYQKLDRLLKFGFAELEEERRFKSDLAKTFYKNHCGKSLSQQEYQTLYRVLEHCLPEVEERARFMKDMTSKTVFENYCEMLLSKMDYEKLDVFLKGYCSLVEEVKQFKQNLVFSSTHVRNTCLIYYSSGSTIQLNNYLMQLLAPYTDLIFTFKIKLLKSSEGIRKCIDLFTSPTDVASLIIEDTLKDSNQVIQFKKSLIMSQYAISKLKKLLINNGLNVVKSCYDRYLMSGEDKKNFKKFLVGDVVKQIRFILQSNHETYLQSFMLWYFGDEDAVQKFKKSMALEFIFIDLLKDGTFLQYDRILPNCKFRTSFDPKVVDRFLNWYFESPRDRMQFKMRVIRNYSKFEMFNTLLRKTDVSYLKAIVQWFFQNDAVEIARFKSVSSFHKISKLL